MSATHRDWHFHPDAASELRTQIRRARTSLSRLACAASASDASLPEDWVGLVERKHVLQAAATLFGPTKRVGKSSRSARGKQLFISYAEKDGDFANEVADELLKEGVRSFLAKKSIKPPTEWLDRIWDAMHGCQVVLAIITPAFIESDWCKYEMGAALVLKREVVPALRHVRRGPQILRAFQSVRLETRPQQKELVRSLKKTCGR